GSEVDGAKLFLHAALPVDPRVQAALEGDVACVSTDGEEPDGTGLEDKRGHLSGDGVYAELLQEIGKKLNARNGN
ncbi:Hypothetical protein FKW44_015841, partial [Caligus rogercresseyi]